MPRDRQPAGECPQCGANELECTYNHFESDELTIDSWEHKCPNCGFRDTKAYRSDDEPEDEVDAVIAPHTCPYCERLRAAK